MATPAQRLALARMRLQLLGEEEEDEAPATREERRRLEARIAELEPEVPQPVRLPYPDD